jgi:hypothetical protein
MKLIETLIFIYAALSGLSRREKKHRIWAFVKPLPVLLSQFTVLVGDPPASRGLRRTPIEDIFRSSTFLNCFGSISDTPFLETVHGYSETDRA